MKLYLFLLLTIIIYCFGQILVDRKGKNFYLKKSKNQIYDILWENLPDLYNYKEIVDILAIIVSIYGFLYMKVPVEKFLILFGVIVILRSIFLQTMILPKYYRCERNTISEIIIKGCYDKLFSGHFSYVYLITLFSNLSPSLSLFINTLNGFLITSSRRHYTIDIILSFLVTKTIFSNKDIILNTIL